MKNTSFPLQIIRLASCALACISLPLASARAAPIDDLLARNFAWRGGAAYARMQSLRQEGELEMAGMQGAFSSTCDQLGQCLQQVDLGPIHEREAYALRGSWHRSLSGQLDVPPQAEIDNNLLTSSVLFAQGWQAQGARKVSLQAEQQFEGHRCALVRIETAPDNRVDLCLDAATGEEFGYVSVSPGNTSRVIETDWRWVDGVRLPFQVRTIPEQDAQNAQLVRMRRVEVNVELDARWLQAPAQERHVAIEGGAQRSKDLEFQLFQGSQILLPVLINGMRAQALLDSGAEVSIIDADFARKAGILAQGQVAVGGTGGAGSVAIADPLDIHIGDLTLTGVTPAVMPLAPLAAASGIDFQVVVGREVFGELAIDIDFAHARIGFELPEAVLAPPGSESVALTATGNGMRAIPVRIEGGEPVLALLDLGNNAALAVGKELSRANGLAQREPSAVTITGGVGGFIEQKETSVRSLQVGSFVMHDVPTLVAAEGAAALNAPQTPANVGVEVLSRFQLLLDFPHQRMFLRPAGDIDAPFTKDHVGFVLDDRSDPRGWIVRAVSRTAPGVQQWKAGDVVRQVDGTPVAALARSEVIRRPVGTVLRLSGVDADGKAFDRSIHLQSYY